MMVSFSYSLKFFRYYDVKYFFCLYFWSILKGDLQCRYINSSKLLELRSMPHLKVLKYDSYDRNCVDLKRQKLKLFMPKLMKDKTYLNIANWNYEDWRHICWFYLVNLWCQIKEKFWIKPCLQSQKKM